LPVTSTFDKVLKLVTFASMKKPTISLHIIVDNNKLMHHDATEDKQNDHW